MRRPFVRGQGRLPPDQPTGVGPSEAAPREAARSPPPAPGHPHDDRIALQALAQEQAVFERRLAMDRRLFALHLTMSWLTLPLLPASAVAALVEPSAMPVLMPLAGVTAWNWRRVLKRDGGHLDPATQHPRDRA